MKLDAFPKFDKERYNDRLTLEEQRTMLKEKGVVPHRPWNTRPIMMTTSNLVFDE